MIAFFFLVILLLASSCTAMDNPFLKTITLNGPVKFSPDGKHLLVFEEKNVAVYDTNAACKKGNLPDLPKEYDFLDGERLFAFSPQGTYATFPKALCHIWNLKTVQKHLADIAIPCQIVWNSLETRFISVPRSGGRLNISRVYDTQTGQVLYVMDTRFSNAPDHVSINDDGSMAAFIISENAIKIAVIQNIYNGYFAIEDAQQVTFCADNIHALIIHQGNQVLIYNNKNMHNWQQFQCPASRRMFEGGKQPLNRLKMHINGLQTTVKNEGSRRERYIITQDGDTFTPAQHTKPYTKEKTIPGNTKSLALIKKIELFPFVEAWHTMISF